MLLLQMQLNKQATKERLSLATVSVIGFHNEKLFRKLPCSCNANKTLLCFAGIWLPESSCGSHLIQISVEHIENVHIVTQ